MAANDNTNPGECAMTPVSTNLDAVGKSISELRADKECQLTEAVKTAEQEIVTAALATLPQWWHWPAVFGIVGHGKVVPSLTPILFSEDAILLGLDAWGVVMDLGPVSIPFTAIEHATAFGRHTDTSGDGYIADRAKGVCLADGTVVISDVVEDEQPVW